MRIDLLNAFSWDETNELLREKLPANIFPTSADLRIYSGLSQGVFEIVFGLGLLYSHRKNAAFLSGKTWAFEGVLPALYKEGFQIQDQRRYSMPQGREWIESLKKDTSFVMWNEDHPVTGKYFYDDDFDAALNEKRIFSIRVSHASFLTRPSEIRPYSVRVCSLTPTLTVAICGTKVKPPPLAVHRQVWNEEQTLKEVLQAVTGHREDRALVESFESQVVASTGFRPLLSNVDRLFDRAVIYHPEINAEHLFSGFQDAIQRPVAKPMFESDLEILNQCRWRPAPHLRTWWDPLPTEEIIRGMMLFSLPTLQLGDVMKRLSSIEKNASLTIG